LSNDERDATTTVAFERYNLRLGFTHRCCVIFDPEPLRGSIARRASHEIVV
jgi:hypothetical protein